MRRFLVFLCVLLWAPSVGAQVTYVDHDYQQSTNAGTTRTASVDVLEDDVIVACGLTNSTAAGTMTWADSQSNTYATPITSVHNTTVAPVSLTYARAGSAGTVTVTMTTSSADYRGVFLATFRGVAAASPLDDSDIDDEAADATVTTPAMTATGSGVAFGCFNMWAAVTVDPGSGSGWSPIDEDQTFSNVAGGSFYKIVSGAGSETFAADIGGTETWAAASLILKEEVAVASIKTMTLLGVGGGAAVDAPESFDSGCYRPHLQGFGCDSIGGRGGTLLTVTNLNNSGAGSLRAALEASGARFVVFEVSGTITLSTDITIDDPYLTVAGQTAPTGSEGSGAAGVGGILIKGKTIIVQTHDVVLQHLRIRRGNCGDGDVPAIQFGNFNGIDIAYKVINDHLSVTWGCNNTSQFSVNINTYDILTVDSIIGEPIWSAGGDSGVNYLTYSSEDCTTTIARNYFPNTGNRNPWISSGCDAAVYNNVTYNADFPTSGDDGTYGFVQFVGQGMDYTEAETEFAYVSNVNLVGPDSTLPDGTVGVHFETSYLVEGVRMYMADNSGPGITNLTEAGQKAGVHYNYDATEGDVWCNAACLAGNFPWYHTHDYRIIDHDDVAAAVLSNAGAFATDRDAVDQRLVQDYADAISSPPGDGDATISSETGGFPTIAARTRTYTDPASPNAVGSCGGSRTNRECHLESDDEFGAQRLEDPYVF